MNYIISPIQSTGGMNPRRMTVPFTGSFIAGAAIVVIVAALLVFIVSFACAAICLQHTAGREVLPKHTAACLTMPRSPGSLPISAEEAAYIESMEPMEE